MKTESSRIECGWVMRIRALTWSKQPVHVGTNCDTRMMIDMQEGHMLMLLSQYKEYRVE